MNNIKILIVEDNEITAELMKEFLVMCGFDVEIKYTVTDGISSIRLKKYDMILLDLNLPDFDGFELLKSLKNKMGIPVIVISAFSDTKNKVMAFKYGASDYMIKPVDFEELEARIWAILGRNNQIQTIEEKNIFSIENSVVFFDLIPLELTGIEFEILSFLIKNKNQTIPREKLLDRLSSSATHRSLDQHIKNIRKKINEDGANPKYLKTIYAEGYRLVF